MVFRGSGSATPQRSISNTELGQRVETSDDWIRSRTGIAARRVIGADESLGELNGLAAERALAMAGWSADSLDLILLATSTPDDLFGSAPRLQARIGAVNAAAFDLTAACSGFLFAVVTAAQYLRTGAMQRILVVGADQLSRWVDWDDRRSCVLFGDADGPSSPLFGGPACEVRARASATGDATLSDADSTRYDTIPRKRTGSI